MAKMSTINELTDETFTSTVASSSTPLLVQFSATWCQPCKMLTPTIEEVAREYDGKLEVYKVDIDQAPQTTEAHSIVGVPTCVFIKGGQVVERFSGTRDLRSIKGMVEKVLA